MEHGARYRSLQDAVRHLRVGDIVLMRKKRGPIAHFIKRTSGSYWSHVALVFHVARISRFDPDILLVEARDQGIEIHRLNVYSNRPETYDIGVKRVKGLTAAERIRFRGFFLDAVDTPYDWNRLESYLLNALIKRATGRDYSDAIARRSVNPDNYLCTTFAQRAYYLAVAPAKRGKVLFRPAEGARNFLDQMEVIAPGDVARSANTEWLYNPHY